MRAGRTAAAGLVAGVLALSLVAAETAPATTGVGSATTSLLGAEVRITGPLQTPVTRVLDIATTATTEGSPLAVTSIVPLAVGDRQVGAAGASSSGNGSASTEKGTVGELGGLLGASVQPIQTTATASADRALAEVGAAAGQIQALLGQLGLELDTTGVTSLVTREGSAATQGLQVSSLSLSLGDLGLDADLLGQLGLGNLLELLASLPGLLPSDLADVAAIQGLITELEEALASLPTSAGPVNDTIDQLAAAAQELADLEALEATLQALTSLNVANLLAALGDAGLLADLDAVGCALGTVNPLNPTAALTGALDCVGDAVADATAIVGSLTGLLPDELQPVLDVLDEIVALLEDILAGVGDLDDLLALLPDLLTSAAGTELLGVGAFDVGATALAGPTVADSSAAVLCDAVDVSVLGESFATPDCSEALDQLPDVTGAISAAVGQLSGVLNSLPITDLVQVGDLRADVFTDVVEQVTEADGVVTSTAGFTLLDLEVPSVTIDPSQVTDALGGLGLPDVLGPVQQVLGELQSGLTTLQGLGVAGVGTLLTTVNDTLTSVGAPSGLTGTVDAVQSLIEGLELGDLGTLTEQVSTPGLQLMIDPVSTATFSAVAVPAPAPAPTPAPGPAPAPTPSLPSTGGGLALLGVLALAGAGALRRRS